MGNSEIIWQQKYETEHKLRQEAQKENKNLKIEICELRNDNRKLAHQVEDRVNQMRKAGLI